MPMMRKQAAKPDPIVKSAARAIGILRLFSERQVPLGVCDVATALDYPQSSTSMLMHSMHRMGYLEYLDNTRCFFPTVCVATLGGWLNNALLPEQGLTNAMQELSRTTGETAFLSLQNGIHVQYAGVYPPGKSPTRADSGHKQQYIHSTAAGRLLLSLRSDADISRLLRRVSTVTGSGPERVDVNRVMTEVQRCRDQGFAESCGDLLPGRTVLAMRLPLPATQPPLAVGISGAAEKFARTRPALLAALSELAGRFAASQATA